ncbi:MAG: hypothetical protein ACRYGK_15000, partial [Janthinobacterium lividum]
MRRKTDISKIENKPSKKKNRYFGIASHHQSKNLVYRKIANRTVPVCVVSFHLRRTPSQMAHAQMMKPA